MRRRWPRPPYRILGVFLGIICVSVGALAWLWSQLLFQDRELESQRIQERLETSADRIANTLDTGIQELDRWLPRALNGQDESTPAGLTLLLSTSRGVTVRPAGRLLYLPSTTAGSRVDGIFDEGEFAEFQANDLAAAADFYRSLVRSPNPAIRAGALLRLGRTLRKAGRYEDALVVYAELMRLPDVPIEGVPAELVALDARSSLFQAMGRTADLLKEAAAMDAGLRSARWSIAGSAWEFYRQEAGRWGNTTPLTGDEQQALTVSRAAEWISQLAPGDAQTKGRRILRLPSGPALISWTTTARGLAAVMMAPEALQALWRQAGSHSRDRAALIDAEGQIMLGSLVKNARRVSRSPAESGLPGTLLVTSGDPGSDAADFAVHRRYLWIAFAVLGSVLLAGFGFILHAISREHQLRRLQTEFVAAVSHEFRTPLTSLRHLSEMLLHDRVAAEAEKHQAYDVMFHATERLYRLVESLLDFGRMQEAAFQYRFETVSVATLVEQVVTDFRRQTAPTHTIELHQSDSLPAIQADREALGMAIWNVLDNAVKYSPEAPAVWIATTMVARRIEISVRDTGVGVEASEQTRIFDRFVRGSSARRSNIKGTGIGLSLAQGVVQAHGGEIRLVSEPGKGSTFTIVLPSERLE